LKEALKQIADDKWPAHIPIENDCGEINDRELIEWMMDVAQKALAETPDAAPKESPSSQVCCERNVQNSSNSNESELKSEAVLSMRKEPKSSCPDCHLGFLCMKHCPHEPREKNGKTYCQVCCRELDAPKSPPSSSEHKEEVRTLAPNISEGAQACEHKGITARYDGGWCVAVKCNACELIMGDWRYFGPKIPPGKSCQLT
jgi:hypothetical protein